MFVEIAVIGFGEDHDRALKHYNKITKHHDHVRVTAFTDHLDPAILVKQLVSLIDPKSIQQIKANQDKAQVQVPSTAVNNATYDDFNNLYYTSQNIPNTSNNSNMAQNVQYAPNTGQVQYTGQNVQYVGTTQQNVQYVPNTGQNVQYSTVVQTAPYTNNTGQNIQYTDTTINSQGNYYGTAPPLNPSS